MYRNRKTAASALVLTSALAIGFLSRAPLSATPAIPDPTSGDLEIGGRIETDYFHMPAGETVWVKEDLVLEVSGDVLIEGKLLGRPAALFTENASEMDIKNGALNGISMDIQCQGKLEVTGDLIAGRGAHAYEGSTNLERCVLAGGNGGSLVVAGSSILVNGRIMGGSGGNSGPNAQATAGGSLTVGGSAFTTREDPGVEGETHQERRARLAMPGGFGLFGGAAGRHKSPRSFTPLHPPGNGGRGGGLYRIQRWKFAKK
ncbi:MAG: hypothetical protein CMJ87_00840 [Planctomycetes bacterium]|nr:hypothetical protein [Planctomycetota bacterium]